MTTESMTFVPSTWNRIGARWLDQVFLSMVIVPILLLMPESEDGWLQVPLAWAIFLLLFPLFYESFCLYFFQATPGKWIFNLKVLPASPESEKQWFVHSLIRALISYVGIFMGALYATAFFRYDRRHLGDWLAETKVVGAKPTKRHQLRPAWGAVILVLGLIQGWFSTVDQIQNIDYEDGAVYIADPTVVGFDVDEE